MMAANPELVAERAKATFNPAELTTFLDEGEQNTKERKETEKIYYDDPNMPDGLALLNLSPDEIYESTLKTIKYFESKLSKLDLPGQVFGKTQYIRSGYIRPIAHPAENPMVVCSLMFTPTILSHSSPELQAKMMPLINEAKVFGTYAQTELGHGTNIRELETTATYDAETEEFILNSPTITSIKVWAGGMGRSCNYAIVMAQLHINGTCHGLHMFLVQLRNLNDHSPMPGITIGEVGPKMGLQATDNGFLRLNNVRIPRGQMLMKYAQVLKDGTFIKPKYGHASYSTMVFTRVMVLQVSYSYLAQACTIAVRFNAVRRQGAIESGSPEVQIIDYQTQQAKLFPQVAVSYALMFTFQAVNRYFSQVLGDHNKATLNECHALTCCIKAVASSASAEGAEICRRACGGLGYLQASRLPWLLASATATCTYEGDNTVLLLQTGRYLVKSMKMIEDGEPIGSTVAYLKTQHRRGSQSSCLDELVQFFELTAANKVKDLTEKITTEIAQGQKMELAWQENSLTATRCAHLHGQVYMLRCLHEFLCANSMTKELRLVLEQLFTLVGIQWLLENAKEFVRYGGVSKEMLQELESRMPSLLKDLRPNIVPLVDAFDFCDASLHSVIGCYDGRVYERLYDYWAKLPANKQQRPDFNPVKAHL